MPFLKTRKVEKNYDLFSGCAWYTPGVAGVFAILAWFLVGMIIGGLVNLGLLLFLPGFPLYYSMLIVYPVQFLPVLMYVRLKSMRTPRSTGATPWTAIISGRKEERSRLSSRLSARWLWP